jgi:hypothetical protein
MSIPKVQVLVDGISSEQDLPVLAQAVNEDLEQFDQYMERMSMSRLAAFERALIRTYVAWKLLRQPKELEHGNQTGGDKDLRPLQKGGADGGDEYGFGRPS